MKKFDCFIATMALSIIASALSSCVNEEYDVDNLNTEVTLASEGLILPLGTTKPLTLKTLFSDMDADVLQVLDGGAYALRINDGISLRDQIPSLDEVLEMPDMSLPEILYEYEHPMGIWEYGKSAKEMEVQVADIHVITPKLFKLPDNLSVTDVNEIHLGDFPGTVVDPISVSVIVNSESPDGISNVGDVKMTSSSMMKITVSLQDSFITSGEVVPDMVLDFTDLMTVDGGKGNIEITDDYILNEANGYSVSRSYNIEMINILESDWNGNILDMMRTMEVSGRAVLLDAMTNIDKVAADKGGINLKVDVEFTDIAVESVTMDLDDVEVVEEMDILLELDEMMLPEGIRSIEKVVFKDGSYLDLVLRLENIDRIKGLESRLSRLEMIFPEEIIVKEAVNGKLVVTDVDISEGLEEKIHIEEISFPDPVNGIISYCADIKVNAVVTAEGRVCSADMPSTPNEDAVLNVKAKSCFDIDHFNFDIDGPEHKLELEPFEFMFEIPDDLPAFMKNESFVLDLVNPHLVVKAKTNIGIPVRGDIVINPVIGGIVNKDGQVKASIALPYTETASEVDSVMFWFGKDRTICPADYTFVEADISRLIRRIPDEIQFSLTAGTDPDASCVIEPSADYILDLEYGLVVPLEFGKDLNVEFIDTLEGIPDILGQLLEKNPVQLSGNITNSLPLALEMKLDMLDLNYNVIPVEKPAVQVISACDQDGKAVHTPLDLTLDVKDGISSTDLSSIKVTFIVTSPGLAGIPVDEEDFVKADIKLCLPEGITVDADALNSDQN